MFFTLYGCTRLALVEGQHRMELTARAAFGFCVDEDNIGVPLRNDDDRDVKYSEDSPIYKTVGVSVVCDRTDYDALTQQGVEDDRSVPILGLQSISRAAQDQSTTVVHTPALNTFMKIFGELSTGLQKSVEFRKLFFCVDDGKSSAMTNPDEIIYTMFNQQTGTYNERVVEYVEKYIMRLLIEEEPFKSYITVGKIKEQKNRVRQALENAKSSAGVWMYIVSKAGSSTHRPKGPTAVYHHSNVTLSPKATDPSFKMNSRPYDIIEMFKHQGGKWIGTLISDCTSSAPYEMNSVTAMYSMVIDLCQFGVCVPFVRDSYLRMGAEIKNASNHPVSDHLWFVTYVLIPCKSITDILLYHITKKIRVLDSNSKYMKSQTRSTPTIFDVNDTTSLKDLTYKVRRSSSQGGTLVEEQAQETNEASDVATETNHMKKIKEDAELAKKLLEKLEHNLDASKCDASSFGDTLASVANYATPNEKLRTYIYARALEMYFDLLRVYSTSSTEAESVVLSDNPSLKSLRDAIVKLQESQVKEASKYINTL